MLQLDMRSGCRADIKPALCNTVMNSVMYVFFSEFLRSHTINIKLGKELVFACKQNTYTASSVPGFSQCIFLV